MSAEEQLDIPQILMRLPLFAELSPGQIADLATDHLSKARTAIRALPKSLRSAFAPIAVLDLQLEQAQRGKRPAGQG